MMTHLHLHMDVLMPQEENKIFVTEARWATNITMYYLVISEKLKSENLANR